MTRSIEADPPGTAGRGRSVRPSGPAKRRQTPGYVRPLAGLGTVLAIAGIIAVAAGLFRGSFTTTVPVTVVAQRAGLVMNPDAKVKIRGVQVGKVASIKERPGGEAEIQLAMDPAQMHLIPDDVVVNIAASTAFGAKYIDLVDPAPGKRSVRSLHAGQVLQGEHVTVEINTVFQQLTSVLAKVDPAKLNETLGAIAAAFNGRGEQFGQALSDMDNLLAKLNPSLQQLSHEFEAMPGVTNAYADAAPDLIQTVDNATRISQSIVDEQRNLDTMLISAIGLADTGTDVVGTNRQALTNAVHLLAPTTDILNEYHEGLNCSLLGLRGFMHTPAMPDPGLTILAGLTMGIERYRYPRDLPKVAATGGPHCKDMYLPDVPFQVNPPYLVTDNGSNPFRYGNQGLLANSDALKQWLYGPLDGPPRNTAQIGMPG